MLFGEGNPIERGLRPLSLRTPAFGKRERKIPRNKIQGKVPNKWCKTIGGFQPSLE
jgi:hypothetical protein